MSDEGQQLYQRRQLLHFKLNGIIFSDYFESPDIYEHRFSGLTSVGNSRNHNFGAFLCIQHIVFDTKIKKFRIEKIFRTFH